MKTDEVMCIFVIKDDKFKDEGETNYYLALALDLKTASIS